MFLGYFCSLPLPHDLTHGLPLPTTEPYVLCGQEEPPLETLRCIGMAKPILMGWWGCGMGSWGAELRASPRRHSQGQEEVDPVVEVAGQPDTAEVLHHHGKQVLCGHRRQANSRGGESVPHGPQVLPHPTAMAGTPQGGLCWGPVACGEEPMGSQEKMPIGRPGRRDVSSDTEGGSPQGFSHPTRNLVLWFSGGDCVDPAAPPHFGAADTLSDTLRKMSASKKLWITGSSAKEGRSKGGLGAALLGELSGGLWDIPEGRRKTGTSPLSLCLPEVEAASLPPGGLWVLIFVTVAFLSSEACREFQLWVLDFAIISFHVMGRDTSTDHRDVTWLSVLNTFAPSQSLAAARVSVTVHLSLSLYHAAAMWRFLPPPINRVPWACGVRSTAPGGAGCPALFLLDPLISCR